jgi:ubiquinol-cytochrome c reductase cytochrome c1 subunit
MIRPIAMLVGAFFVGALMWAIVKTPLTNEVDKMKAFHLEPKELHLASDGPFGHWDVAQLQRGMKVYKEVCAACHGLGQVAFYDFKALGYDEAQVKAIAASWPIQAQTINPDTGEAATRAPIISDKLPQPYLNEVAARAANGNAYPPDLSLITKAREGHAPYLYSLLVGYRNPPANLPEDLRPTGSLHYNPYFANLNIAMPPPLTGEGQVTYDDGTRATVDQMAKDVTAFLVWTAEPKLVTRHSYGWAILGFLLVLTTLAYMSYRSIWADKKH